MKTAFLSLATAATLTLAGAAQAATLGLLPGDPIATATGSISLFGDTLEVTAPTTTSTTAALDGLPLLFLLDPIGGDLEIGLEVAQVLETGFTDGTLEFLLSGEFAALPDGALLTIESEAFTGIDPGGVINWLTFAYPSGFTNITGRVTVSAIAPIPLPGAGAVLLLGLATIGVARRRQRV